MKISIVVPVYNVEKYLDVCLQSIVEQTFRDFEVVTVNDGSTDGSLKILQEWAKKDSRIKVINQENKGVSAARNAGLDVAQGEYICFIDSDDYVHPQLLEFLLEAAETTESCMALCDYCSEEQYEKSAYEWNENLCIQGAVNAKFYLDNVRLLHYAIYPKLIRRDIIGKLRFGNWSCAEDWCFNLELSMNCFRFIKLKLPLYVYRENQNSISRTPFSSKKIESYCSEAEYFCKKYKNTNVFPVLKELFFRRLAMMTIGEIRKAPSLGEKKRLREIYAPRLWELYKNKALPMKAFSWRQRLKFWLFVFEGLLRI